MAELAIVLDKGFEENCVRLFSFEDPILKNAFGSTQGRVLKLLWSSYSEDAAPLSSLHQTPLFKTGLVGEIWSEFLYIAVNERKDSGGQNYYVFNVLKDGEVR